MSILGNLIRVSDAELDSFLKNPPLLEDKIENAFENQVEWVLDLDQSWDGLNFILTGDIVGGLERVPNTRERALFSFQLIDEEQDLGYGPAHYLTSAQVKETYQEIKKVTDDVFKNKYKAAKMNELGIYPDIWTEGNSQEYLKEFFKDLKFFYKEASENNQAIISFLT